MLNTWHVIGCIDGDVKVVPLVAIPDSLPFATIFNDRAFTEPLWVWTVVVADGCDVLEAGRAAYALQQQRESD